VRRIAGLGSVKGFRKDPESHGRGGIAMKPYRRQVPCRAVKPLSIRPARRVATKSLADRTQSCSAPRIESGEGSD